MMNHAKDATQSWLKEHLNKKLLAPWEDGHEDVKDHAAGI